MTLLMRPEAVRPASRPIVGSRGRLRLGMPHLALMGLSETWLLKDLGHRHWMLLAAMGGREVPNFTDGEGRPAYAAFCAMSITDAAFGRLGEHDELDITSELGRISLTQFASRHQLAHAGRPVGSVTLSSVFVARKMAGRNRSITRVCLDGFPPPCALPHLTGPAQLAAAMRGDLWDHHFGFDRHQAGHHGEASFLPCPSQDFNGAKFLYFASFQALADRAEWDLIGAGTQELSTAARDIVYHGNVEVGERVTLRLCGLSRDEDSLRHWFQCRGAGDGRLLADIFTRRTRQAR